MSENSNSSRQFFNGNTLELAVQAGASHFGIEPDELAYERVERKGGFMRGRRGVIIKVDAGRPRRDSSTDGNRAPEVSAPPRVAPVAQEPSAPPSPPAPAAEEVAVAAQVRSQPGAPPVEQPVQKPAVAAEPLSDELRSAVNRGVKLLGQLGDLDVIAVVEQGDGQLEVELKGEDAGLLIRGEGRLLMAFQQLLPRVLQGLTGELQPCRVDSGGFRQERVLALEGQARQAAEEVLNSGSAKLLGSMSPADRRTVHLAIEEMQGVTTESQGHGFYKKITVRPA